MEHWVKMGYLLNYSSVNINSMFIWDKVFKNGPSKICGRQPLKNLKGYGLPKQTILKTVIHKFFLAHS